MAAQNLTKSQQHTVKLLNDNILNPDSLAQRCPLHYGLHQLAPKTSLEALHVLSTELLDEVLGYLDSQSLLVFRRVNQQAMKAVNDLIEFKKIMTNAPNVIRMAVGIRTASTFNIKQLFQKLCQRTCDASYGKPSPYLDVFKLSRTCLWVGGMCDTSRGPRSAAFLTETALILDRQTSKQIPMIQPGDVASFRAIEALYGGWDTLRGISSYFFANERVDDELCYFDSAAFKAFLAVRGYSSFRMFEEERSTFDDAWKLTAVFATFFSTTSMNAKYEVVCWTYAVKESAISNARPLRRQRLRGDPPPSDLLDVSRIAYGTLEDLAAHAKNQHSKELASVNP